MRKITKKDMSALLDSANIRQVVNDLIQLSLQDLLIDCKNGLGQSPEKDAELQKEIDLVERLKERLGLLHTAKMKDLGDELEEEEEEEMPDRIAEGKAEKKEEKVPDEANEKNA